MPVATRKPLNYDAPDLRGALDTDRFELRMEIDYWRAQVHRSAARLAEAQRLAGLKFHAPHVLVNTPEQAGACHRRDLAALHFLPQLARLPARDPTSPTHASADRTRMQMGKSESVR